MSLRVARLLGACVLSVLCPALALAQTGAVSGVVADAASRAPLVGAAVLIEGTSITTATDRAGRFIITGVPAGTHTLVVSYLGHVEQRTEIAVPAGRALAVAVDLGRAAFNETVVVTAGTIGQGQAQALNQQKTAANISNIISADQIGSFPDPNAAEAASRIPGVSIARDQGEGRYVLIRGTEARLNSMLIDGERIPAPEGDSRQVSLDAIPADQLQSIVVAKAVTPDMDADSIGGAVNLITKQAVGRPTALFSLAGGYNALQRSADQKQFSGTLGRRFNQGRVGLLIGASAASLDRGSENFEAQYANGGLSDLQLRDYAITRERYAVNISGDVRVTGGTLLVKTIFNEFKDYEVNNRIRFRPPNSRIEHVLKNRQQDQHIRSVLIGGEHVAAGRTTIDYRAGWAEAMENQPDRIDTVFRQTGITFSPNVSSSSIDPENIQPNPSVNNAAVARLNSWPTEVFKATDRDLTGSINVRTPLGAREGLVSVLKLGGKVKGKSKVRDFQVGATTPAAVVLFPELQDSSFDNSRFLEFFPAGYAPFPGINPEASRALFAANAARHVVDRAGDASAYRASERLYAGYGMVELFVGDRLLLLPGVRYESTTVDYTGNEVRYNTAGQYVSTVPVTGGDTSGYLLPGFHTRYAIDDQTNIRAAYTRTLARPNYYSLVPFELVRQDSNTISRGNAGLRPTTSDNLDLLAERYFRSVGVVSGGVFYKQLEDYIFAFRAQETAFGQLFEVTQPRNGDGASLWGAELAFQNQLRFLPRPFDGLGVYANYTWTDSSARFPDRNETSTLPGQSNHLGNLAVSFEKAGFSARSSWNFHGKYVDAVGDSAARDVYYDNHVQWDLSISQQLLGRARVFADFLNLTNAPLRYFEGVTTRPLQEEYYRSWSTFGVKLNF